ncbi:MAG: hypothetical protein L0H00_03760 [Micrococcales bacterium]|nr:hypothetical protein [Micrococcales bacterium]
MSHATTSSSTASEAASRLEAEREAHGPDVIVLDHTAYVGHGNTVAAWACVAIMAVGVVLGLIGLVQELGSVLMWVGVGVIVLGLIVGAVLKGMGMGYEGEARKHERGELKH